MKWHIDENKCFKDWSQYRNVYTYADIKDKSETPYEI